LEWIGAVASPAAMMNKKARTTIIPMNDRSTGSKKL
jgi:hypothetical protein